MSFCGIEEGILQIHSRRLSEQQERDQQPDSLERYLIRRGKGLELRNRRPDRKRHIVV